MALAGLNTLTALARLLPERDPHAGLYDASRIVLEHIAEPEIWPGLLVRWELALLNELGFGLDLDVCAATGEPHDLAYVSPKSGRAVSREAAEPYKAKLLPLPPFLAGDAEAGAGQAEILQGFALTGYFLDKNVLTPRNLLLPEARGRLISSLEKMRRA